MGSLKTILLIVFILFISKLQSDAMGMDYYLIPNKHSNCPNDFGNGLSFFFEQVGGYGETAEVEQVSTILKINLSVFQDYNYDYEDTNDIRNHWHEINSMSTLVDTFISRIVANPDYYKQVKHNPDVDKQWNEEKRIWNIADTAERNRQLDLLHKKPFYFYPPDYKYLSEGRLLADLRTFRNTLACYKKEWRDENSL